MDIFIPLKRLDQCFVLGKVSEESQFNLRIVCRSNNPSLFRDEGLADPTSLIRADGDVLQVGITRREPSGGRDRLVIRSVNPSGLWMNELGKSIDVSGFELAQ